MNEKENGLQIEVTPEVASGNYSNLAIISHSGTEFILDFAQLLPSNPKAHVCSRVILAPEHAKRLMNALIDNVKKYESQFGPITFRQPKPTGTINLTDLMGGNNGSKS